MPPPLTELEGLTDEESFILDTHESDGDFLQLLSTTPCGATPSDMNQALSATPTPLPILFLCYTWDFLVDGFKKRVKAQRVLAFAHILQDYSKLLKREKNRKGKQHGLRLKKGLWDFERNEEAKDQVLHNPLIIFANERHCKLFFFVSLSPHLMPQHISGLYR